MSGDGVPRRVGPEDFGRSSPIPASALQKLELLPQRQEELLWSL